MLRLVLALIVAATLLTGCIGSASPTSPTTMAIPSPTARPSATPAATPRPSASATPASAPTVAVATPTSLTSAASAMAQDLIAKASANAEYSFDERITVAGMAFSGTVHVKGQKMRQELGLAGQKAPKTAIVVDLGSSLAYVLGPDGKAATKVDLAKLAAQGSSETPTERVAALLPEATLVGTDTVDGKPTVVFESPADSGRVRVWVSTDQGVPLRLMVPGTKADAPDMTIEFTNYKFESQPDSLFSVPGGG